MRVRGGGLSGGVTVKMTRAIAWSAATDAGNRSMRKAGRKAWSKMTTTQRWRSLNACGRKRQFWGGWGWLGGGQPHSVRGREG